MNEIRDMVRTLLSIDPGAPWFSVTRNVQRAHPHLEGRQGKRKINREIGSMISFGEIHQSGSALRLIKISEDQA